ncbi:glycoside hydrolase family 15 protein [Melanomma pulvis-pyrius CBS 109.77]|uniref:glucan 1,4-alpha-glucosidase n=1 Tax=Melanomma pulvis-pyrius CBS 109.77 TaxID=1314802 RepID=A0A6A6XPE5_9PLEO|nr:glycoside hydrolase family 15 protein [Melanomma pulvis-pyrius CBS 109.77]
MTLLLPLVLVAYIVLYAFALSIPLHLHAVSSLIGGSRGLSGGYAQVQQPLKETLGDWVEREERIALERLLANVAPGGKDLEGVVEGSVVASPSREEPDYFYQWVRDAAITTSTLVDLYADDPSSQLSSSLSTILDAYANLQYTLQHTNNPSGTFSDLSGLGEPKFEIDGAPFVGNWGRPQRDGPALRAITLMAYLRAYNASHPWLWTSDSGEDWFKPLYDPKMPANSIIKADLEYVSHFWNESGFDLWEEVEGLHFFTAMVQMRALREGADLALAFGDDGAAEWYKLQAAYMEAFIPQFWDTQKGHLVETLESKRSGLDCGLLLGSLHGFPAAYANATHTPIYPPHSDEILVSLLALVQDQRTRFPINAAPPSSEDEEEDIVLEGVGLGRYPEDVYDGYGNKHSGGNPWFLCTSSAAEVLFRTAAHVSSTSSLTITDLSLPFYEALLASSSLDVDTGSYGPSDAVFHSVIERLVQTGDEFLSVVKKHAGAEGELSEQFDRNTGYMRGARDLTWSYGAFLQAGRARKATWGLGL